ncbi:hypothetical protein T4A_5734 [Trichinella pseudospiralis]|uniref:Uncharacterized protein n=1 Tax=Trichinella pseudospiralis TaxID=6337 RepID=A0A0V1ESQ5_TRIPS|nr:hypothetical protein T4A_5734 [Trichinella pseudospiralis]
MSMRSLCLLDLNLPEYGDGPVNWERGKHCRHVLCLELLGSSCAVFYLLVVLLTWFILVLPLLLAEVQSTGHESQNTIKTES